MRGQTRLIAALIVVSCCVRFGMAAVGYVDPAWLLQYLGAPPAQNLQGPYVVRVWAIRDIVLAVLVLTARRDSIRALLLMRAFSPPLRGMRPA